MREKKRRGLISNNRYRKEVSINLSACNYNAEQNLSRIFNQDIHN
jgi:hypothetical protein